MKQLAAYRYGTSVTTLVTQLLLEAENLLLGNILRRCVS